MVSKIEMTPPLDEFLAAYDLWRTSSGHLQNYFDEAVARMRTAEAEVERQRDVMEEWRKHPALTLDDDGSAHINLLLIEERDQERIAQYRRRAWEAEHKVEDLEERVRELRATGNPSASTTCDPRNLATTVGP